MKNLLLIAAAVFLAVTLLYPGLGTFWRGACFVVSVAAFGFWYLGRYISKPGLVDIDKEIL